MSILHKQDKIKNEWKQEGKSSFFRTVVVPLGGVILGVGGLLGIANHYLKSPLVFDFNTDKVQKLDNSKLPKQSGFHERIQTCLAAIDPKLIFSYNEGKLTVAKDNPTSGNEKIQTFYVPNPFVFLKDNYNPSSSKEDDGTLGTIQQTDPNRDGLNPDFKPTREDRIILKRFGDCYHAAAVR